MRSKFKWIFTLLLAFSMQFSFAQEKTISGVVNEGGLPLPGVNVLVQGTSNGVQTDFDGKYALKAKVGDVLEFTFLGMKTSTVTVGASNTINISMKEDAEELAVVNIGYTAKTVDQVTGSSVQLNAKQFENVPVVSVDQAMQGKVAGLQVSSSSGTPGAEQDIRIRGVSSITAGNQPLYVIDGVPVMNDNMGDNRDEKNVARITTLSPLASINSKDIATITVLKDASATAAYGARGTNGVIVITTKKGKQGKTSFNFSSTVGIQNDAYNKNNPLSAKQKEELLLEGVYNQFGAANGFGKEGAKDFLLDPANDFAKYTGGYAGWNGQEGNWDKLLRNKDAIMKDYSLSATGGDEKSTFYASLGYNKTEATVIGSAFERISGAFNFTRKLTDKVNFTTSMNVSNSTQNPLLEGGAYFGNPYLTRYMMSPFYQPYNADGSYNITNVGSLHNTLYTLNNDMTRNEMTRAMSNTKVDWELIENLTFSSRISLDFLMNTYKLYRNRYHGDGKVYDGYAESSIRRNYNWVSQNSLNYKFTLDQKHNFDVTALFEYQNNQHNYLYGYGTKFAADGLTNIESAGAAWRAKSSLVDWYNASYLGLLSYNFDNRYVIDATFRREGSSKFVKKKRYGNFGSVGAAWNMHNEEFMLDMPFNELRLRGSYGLTGNSGIDPNKYQPLLSYDEAYGEAGAIYPSQFGNDDLTWEKGETFDVGLSFSMFDRRLSGSFSYFNRRTYDLLLEVPLSLTTGLDKQMQNAGEMKNNGLEVELSYEIIRKNDLVWSVSGNFATVKNKVTKLALDPYGNEIDPFGGSSYKTGKVGSPIATWYMPTWAGVNVDTGAPEWYVNGVNGERTSEYDKAKRVDQGSSPLPKYSGGFSTHVEYKGFFMDASFYFAGGHKIYDRFSQFYFRTYNYSLGTNTGVEALMDRWQQPGDVTDVPKLSFNENDNFHVASSRHLYDGDYIRLKDLTFGYNLPSEVVGLVGLDGVTFTVKGTNLYTWVRDGGLKLDPEVRADGFTGLSTPPVKSFTFGVNIKF